MENKILKCEFENDWKGFEIVELPVDDIWQSVPIAEKVNGQEFYIRVKQDIQKEGMHFPIMCVHSNYNKLEEAKDRWGNKINELPFWHNALGKHKKMVWSVWGGSNRLAIAKDLGYTHIDAAVIPTIKQAISLQKHMRNPYNSRYYNR